MAEKLTDEKRKKPQPQPLSTRKKILTSLAILLGNLTIGCSFNSFSPVLANMRSKYETTIDDISSVFTVMTIMYCCGAIICGFISHYMNRQLIVIFGLTSATMSMCITPYSTSRTMFFVSGGILGFSTGIYDSSQMVWMIEIWQQKAGPFIQTQSLFYSIGGLIPSVLMAPFLNNYDHINVKGTDSSYTDTSTIHIPFLIIATIGSLASLFQLFLFTFFRYHTPPMYANENFESLDDANNITSLIEPELKEKSVSINRQENATVTGISSRKVKLVTITVLFLGVYTAMEVSTMQFLPTFGQYSNLKMTESASAYVLTALAGMSCIGRLIGAIVILKVRPEILIFINFIFVVTGNLILLIWANESSAMFWLGSSILGLGFSTMFPGFAAFMEKYLVFTTSIASTVLVFGSFVSSIYPYIIGKFIGHHAVVLTYTNLFSTIVGIVVMIYGYKLTRKSVTRER